MNWNGLEWMGICSARFPIRGTFINSSIKGTPIYSKHENEAQKQQIMAQYFLY